MIRILHTLTWMNRGGIEIWLMHILRQNDWTRFQMDIMVRSSEIGEFDAEAKKLGARILYVPLNARNVFTTFPSQFRNAWEEYGPYDIVHTHCRVYGGWILREAAKLGAPVRVAHSHNDIARLESRDRVPQKIFLGQTKRATQAHATHLIACSRQAGIGLFGQEWEQDPRAHVAYYGIDVQDFCVHESRALVLQEFGIVNDSFVVGHVGRFYPQKNHSFILDIFAAILEIEPNSHLLLVGDGPLRLEIEQKALALNISDRVIFAGLRDDVPRLMKCGMDVLLFPSLFEGLSVVTMEAQSAGLPMIFSDNFSDEADCIDVLVNRVPLQSSASEWASRVVRARERARGFDRDRGYEIMSDSPFNIASSASRLEEIYLNALGVRA